MRGIFNRNIQGVFKKKQKRIKLLPYGLNWRNTNKSNYQYSLGL